VRRAYPSEQLESQFSSTTRNTENSQKPIFKYYKEHGELPEVTKGTVLPKLIAQHEAGELSLDEVVGIGVVQAIAAAIDTTGQD
jgi:hypothetical protein